MAEVHPDVAQEAFNRAMAKQHKETGDAVAGACAILAIFVAASCALVWLGWCVGLGLRLAGQ